MTFKEYETIIKKFSFLQFMKGSNTAYLNDEIIALPTIKYGNKFDTISYVSVYNTVRLTKDKFETDIYEHETIITPEELYKALLKLVPSYNTWKKNRRLALIKEL